METTVYSVTPEQHHALVELGFAVTGYRHACRRVQQEAERNIVALNDAKANLGFSDQTLMECARTEQRYESALTACRRLRLTDPITAIIKEPDAIYNTERFKKVEV